MHENPYEFFPGERIYLPGIKDQKLSLIKCFLYLVTLSLDFLYYAIWRGPNKEWPELTLGTREVILIALALITNLSLCVDIITFKKAEDGFLIFGMVWIAKIYFISISPVVMVLLFASTTILVAYQKNVSVASYYFRNEIQAFYKDLLKLEPKFNEIKEYNEPRLPEAIPNI